VVTLSTMPTMIDRIGTRIAGLEDLAHAVCPREHHDADRRSRLDMIDATKLAPAAACSSSG